MKKTIISAYVISIIMLILSIIYFNLDSDNTLKSFSVNDYTEYIQEYNNSEENITDEIKNEIEAQTTAEALFVKTYGQKVLKEKPFNVFYDCESDTWLIRGTFHGGLDEVGGVANLIVNSKGEVKALWHEK